MQKCETALKRNKGAWVRKSSFSQVSVNQSLAPKWSRWQTDKLLYFSRIITENHISVICQCKPRDGAFWTEANVCHINLCALHFQFTMFVEFCTAVFLYVTIVVWKGMPEDQQKVDDLCSILSTWLAIPPLVEPLVSAYVVHIWRRWGCAFSFSLKFDIYILPL